MATQPSAMTRGGTTGQDYTDGMRFLRFYSGLPIGTIILSLTVAASLTSWCRGRGLNPHGPWGPQDFKSCASASSATPAS